MLNRRQHNEMADAFLTLALTATTAWEDRPRWLCMLLSFGLGEALILASYALGCNHVDAVVAYFLLVVARTMTLAQTLADSRRSAVSLANSRNVGGESHSFQIALAREGIFNLVISFMLCPLSIVILIGALLPISEFAAGGNYNLRYLSPAARRNLTPFPAVRQSPTQAVPEFGLRPGMAYTLYAPGAGFLWSDSMIWKQSLPESLRNSSNHHDDEADKYWSIDGSYRAFFQDKFVERYPWEVQKVPQLTQKWHSPKVISSGSTVRLYDPTASRYLCVVPGERVISEARYFGTDNSTEQAIDRIRVG